MGTLNLDEAQSIIEFALNWREENGLNPLTVAVLDSAGVLIAIAREDGASNLRPEIAQGKRVARSVWELDHVHCSTARRHNHTSSNP